MDELKSIELDILKEIHSFCKERELRYFLSSGTLLGAVRHKGFIPWDDDADVMMPRPDYDRFIAEYKSDKYILNYPCKPGYYQSICKLADKNTELIQPTPLADKPIGVHVDILPLDGEPDNINKYVDHVGQLILLHDLTFHIRKIKILRNWIYDFRTTLHRLHSLFYYGKYNSANLFEEIEKLAREYDYNKSNYVGYITMSNYRYKQRHRKSLFDETIQVEFEGCYFNAPKGWEEYLTNLFGDYMQLPSEEKRRSAHHWTAYWK